MQRNKYITEGTIDDINNDRMITMHIRDCFNDTFKKLREYEDMGAMAYNEDIIHRIMTTLDDALYEILTPVERLLDEGEHHHEGRDVA